MAISQESFNQNLYDLLRSRGYEPTPIDSKGQASPVPATADVFKFKFNKDPVWVTIDDASNLKVYYDDTVMDKDDDVRENESFSDFLQTLKKWCMRRQLGFELSNRNHLHADMAQREHTKQKEALGEGYHPINRKASYNDSIPTVKVILQHSKQLSETDKRYHNIEKIFVENTNGERFLLPTRRPGIAKVYARHVAEGGTPYDERGSHITSLVEEYTKMAGFVRAVRNGQFNESANSLINEGINHYNNLRETLSRMISQRGYNNYFESYTPVLNEEQIEESNINELFTKSTLDPRIKNVLPILNKLNKNITEVKEANELEEWADKIVEGEVVQLTPSDDGLMGDFIGKDVGVAKPTVSNVKEKYVSRYGDEWETYLLADLLEFLRKKDYPLKLRAKKAHEMLNKIDPTVHADMPYGQFKEATDLKSIPESELDEINLNILKKKPSPEERAAKAYDAARMPSTKDKFKQAYTQMRKDMGLDDNAKTKELVGEEGVAEGEGDDAYVACIVQHNRSGQAMVQRTKPISRDRAEEVIKNALAKSTFVHPPFMTIYPASAGKLDGSTIMAKYPDMSQQGVAKGSQLDEFAPGQGGNGDDGMGYLHALAQAWYTHDLSRLADIARKGGSPIKKIIDAQEAVEKILSRGVHCPDGKVRKYYIDYTADFDGVDMVSHDYYEHSDYGPNDEYVDGRTGKPWSAYDHIEFSDDQLDEGVAEGSGGPSWPEVISALTQGYPDIDPTDALKPLMQKYRVSYNYFDKLAQQQGYKDVFDAYAEFEELPTTGPTMSKGVAEGSENFNGIDIDMDLEGDEIMVRAMANGRELGHVMFVEDGEYLLPQDLEVDERYQGQGIAATMYDYVKSKGYKIRRSGRQTDAGAGFWAKHRPKQNVWEQGVAEGSTMSWIVYRQDTTLYPNGERDHETEVVKTFNNDREAEDYANKLNAANRDVDVYYFVRGKQQGVAEDLDANQKRVGQLGPTEPVGKNEKNLRGKLVGAESVDPEIRRLKKLSGV